MRAVNIVGFKNTGKTTLTLALAQSLEAQGLRIALVKQSHHNLDLPHTDTGRFRGQSKAPHGRTVLALGQNEAALFWGERQELTDLLPLLHADIILIEGAKSLDFLPRILCLGEQDDFANLAAELQAPLALATYSIEEKTGAAHPLHCHGINPENIKKLTQVIIDKAFTLPRLNCTSCGYATCAEMAQALVAGKEKSCPIVQGKVQLHINGQPLALNPFTARIMAGALQGMVQELKGVKKSTQEQEITFSCPL